MGNNNFQKGGYSKPQEEKEIISSVVKREFSAAEYQKEWILCGADSALVAFAEKVGKFMAEKKLTNSKIRSIYGEVKRIQMAEFDKEKSSFYLLKPKVAYALGRDYKNLGLQMFKFLFDVSSADVTDSATYHNFCNLIEAVLAYHKAYGGKDLIL